jgi:N-hydroxyarylamine O-acetyltransferase
MAVDLKAYTTRVGHKGTLAPNLATLKELHLAHATHITFENLDVLLRQPIRLDLESLQAKMIAGGRGGYCFEQNALFAAVLEEIGFRVTRLAARVRMGSRKITPRSHMTLMVEAEGERFLADVGFGGEGLLHPIPMRIDEPAAQFSWTNRIVTEGQFHVLQSRHGSQWFDLYAFTLEEAHAVDYEVANYYISTNPHSPFVRMIFVARPGIEARWTLMNRKLIEQRPDAVKETMLPDSDAVLKVLAERFSLRFPAGTRFPYDDKTQLMD